MGTYFTYVGLLALNGGAVASIHADDDVFVFAETIMNTLIAAAGGALTAMIVCKITDYWKGQGSFWSLHWSLKGGLAGKCYSVCSCDNFFNYMSSVFSLTHLMNNHNETITFLFVHGQIINRLLYKCW